MSNEWIKWEGGECPVGRDKSVFLKFANGKDGFFFRATNIDWDHYGAASDIVAYRLYCEDDTGSFSEHVTHNDQCNCDGCTNGDDEIPKFLRNPMKDDGLTDHELDEPGDGVPEELAIEDIPPVLRPETETSEEDSMDDLERLARELHKALPGVNYGRVVNDQCVWSRCQSTVIVKYPREEIQAKRDDLSGKPKEWVNDWATHRAQDNDGWWKEFSITPVPGIYKFNAPCGKFSPIQYGEVLGDWRDTSEERVCISKSDESETQPDLSIADEKQPAWNGKGQPPVGTVCEWAENLIYDGVGDQCVIYRWRVGDRLECLAHRKAESGEMVAVLWNMDKKSACAVVRNHQGTELYRPIKSDKEKAIDIFHGAICAADTLHDALSKLYDDGYFSDSLY